MERFGADVDAEVIGQEVKRVPVEVSLRSMIPAFLSLPSPVLDTRSPLTAVAAVLVCAGAGGVPIKGRYSTPPDRSTTINHWSALLFLAMPLMLAWAPPHKPRWVPFQRYTRKPKIDGLKTAKAYLFDGSANPLAVSALA